MGNIEAFDNVRLFRRRLRLTQDELGEQLGVEPGTVGRWERGVEAPRAHRVAKLRDMMLRDDDHRVAQRGLAIVRHDIMTAGMADSKSRISELSLSAKLYYQRLGFDPGKLVGWDIRRFADVLGRPDFAAIICGSGVTIGQALLFRFAQNVRGRGHTTVYEPVFEAGEMKGFLHYISERFHFPDNDENTLELVEVINVDDPGSLIVLHRGARARVVDQLRAGDAAR